MNSQPLVFLLAPFTHCSCPSPTAPGMGGWIRILLVFRLNQSKEPVSAWLKKPKSSPILVSVVCSHFRLGNPNLKWEQTTETNIGLDFGFFNQALTGSFDWFNRNTSNILIQPPNPW